MARPFLFFVEVDQYFCAAGMGLAGEDESCGCFFWFEGVVDFHFDLTADELGPAGTAYASFAGVGQICAMQEGCFEDGVTMVGKVECKGNAIYTDGDFATVVVGGIVLPV